MRTRSLDLLHDGLTVRHLHDYVQRYRDLLVEGMSVSHPEHALAGLQVLRGPQQYLDETTLEAIADITEGQRDSFLRLLKETSGDPKSLSLYEQAMHDYETRPDVWDDWHDVGKAVEEFRYLRAMKRAIRLEIDG